MNGKDATNQAAAAFDDTELKCLLLGDENERQKAGDIFKLTTNTYTPG